jgi:hypothetical protein
MNLRGASFGLLSPVVPTLVRWFPTDADVDQMTFWEDLGLGTSLAPPPTSSR